MKKRPISVGRRPVNGDAGGGAQTDRPTASFEEIVLSMQVRLHGLEQKYSTFVSRCLAVLKERKALLTARISGEGGVVDETFRVEMSELSREKDCIEEDIRYMLELKRGSKRKEAGLMDLLKTIDHNCMHSREQIAALTPPNLQISASEVFQSLQRSLQTALIDFNNGKSYHFQEISLLVKQLQEDNSSLQAQVREMDKSEALVAQMRLEKLDLQEKIRLLQSQTPPGSSESPSFSHRDDSLDSPHFPIRADSSPLRSPSDGDISRLKRKLISITKERDLLKVWKQNHVNMSPPALAMMQQLRTELANCTEKYQTLKTYFSDKLKGLTSAASAFLTVSERVVYKRDGTIMGSWENCKSALISALQSNVTHHKDFEISDSHHISTQTAAEETGRPGEDTERRKLQGRLKALEDAVRTEQSEVSKLAKMKAEYESQNGKLILTVTELKRIVDQLTTEKTRWQQTSQSSDLEARIKELEKERKTAIDRWQSEKIAKDRIREQCSRAEMREEDIRQKLCILAQLVESQFENLQRELEPFQGYFERISAAAQAVSRNKQVQEAQLANIRELQRKKSVAGREIVALQAEIRGMDAAREKIATLQRKIAEMEEINEELEEALSREKEVSSDLLVELQRAKSAPQPVNHSDEAAHMREIAILKKEITQITAEKDLLAKKSQQSDQLAEQISVLRAKTEEESRKLERKVADLEGEITVFMENEKESKLEIERMQREIKAKTEHFEEERLDLESYINAQNQNIREAEADLQAASEERHRLEALHQSLQFTLSSQWSLFNKDAPLQDNLTNLIKEWESGVSFKSSLETLVSALQGLISSPKDPQSLSISDKLETTVASVRAWAQAIKADMENLRLSKDHLTELFLRLDKDHDKLNIQLERTLAEMEDLRSSCLQGLPRKSSNIAEKWEREREILFQGFAREKLELKTAYEHELTALRSEMESRNAHKLQPIAAEDLQSDCEIQMVIGEDFAIEVVEEPEVAAAPDQAYLGLYQALCKRAEAEQRDVNELIEQFLAVNEGKQTQTSFKYGDPSYLSMEEDISAVEGALRPDAGSEAHTESFEQAAASLDLSNLPSFDVSEELETPKTKHLPELPFLDKVVRKLQTEPREDFSLNQQYKSLQRDLEDEIQTNRLIEQQLQLLKEEIQQKDRLLQRLGQGAKPALSPEVLSNAFLKLIKSLPQL